MTSGQRSKVQQAWQAGTVQVCVATIAFGMGASSAESSSVGSDGDTCRTTLFVEDMVYPSVLPWMEEEGRIVHISSVLGLVNLQPLPNPRAF
jgi:hypothetical protein